MLVASQWRDRQDFQYRDKRRGVAREARSDDDQIGWLMFVPELFFIALAILCRLTESSRRESERVPTDGAGPIIH